MKVGDIMTRPLHHCRPETDLRTASRRMRQHGCGTLVVLDGAGRLAGIVTDRDLALTIGATARDPGLVTVHEVMTSPVHTVRTDQNVHAALEGMAGARVRRLPVVAKSGDVEGMISIDDIVLWAIGKDAITARELTAALRAICSSHEVVSENSVL